MQIIDGKKIAADVKERLRNDIEQLKAQGKRVPKLIVLLVGEDQASMTYVRNKEKACALIGMESETIRLPETCTQQELLAYVEKLNADESVDGILVQLPLPKHINETIILHAIDPSKDVDGFHPMNIGKMMIKEKTNLPCTPKGIMRMLEEAGCDDLSGLRAVVIGRSKRHRSYLPGSGYPGRCHRRSQNGQA